MIIQNGLYVNSAAMSSPAQLGELAFTMEEEDDLFEINIEAVNSIPPPHYWESYFTSTSSALLANCLLPISHLSSAIPLANTPPLANTKDIIVISSEPMSLGKLLELPFFCSSRLQDKKMKA